LALLLKVLVYAAKIALGIGQKDAPVNIVRGYRYWETDLLNQIRDEPFNIVLTMVGHDRRVNCANACRTLFDNYEVGLCVLLGIAAGPQEKVDLGDVVVGEAVWDYEPMRLEKAGPRKRPDTFNIDKKLGRDIQYFDPDDTGWVDFFREKFAILKRRAKVPLEIDEDWKPKFHSNIILSGDKLVADDSLEKKRNEYHEGMRALEMEASGFAPTCEECDVLWLVFRGISDFGNPETKDRKDPVTGSQKVWQKTAALSAATALVSFIQHEYRRDQEKPF
jgi:nucleoside phosphorylase